MKQKILIAADHGGVVLKAAIKDQFAADYDFIDLGADGTASVDYPDFAHKLAKEIENGTAEFGILICGSGIGISIAANRHGNIRAALCTDPTMARLSRQHNNANVLAMGERIIGQQLAFDITQAFLTSEFEGGRHERRVSKIEMNED